MSSLVEQAVTADEAIALINKAKGIVEADMGVKVSTQTNVRLCQYHALLSVYSRVIYISYSGRMTPQGAEHALGGVPIPVAVQRGRGSRRVSKGGQRTVHHSEDCATRFILEFV